MNLKNSIIEYGANVAIAMAGFYITGEIKFLTPLVAIAIMITRYTGKTITEMMEEDKAGGTTPHNPLKIPKKN